jgi:TPR repeat protein
MHRPLALLAGLWLAGLAPVRADIDVSRLLARDPSAGTARPAERVDAADLAGPAGASPEALFREGQRHDRGDGVPVDMAEAARWYRMAAERGHAGAQVSLGVMLSQGLGVARDEAQAVRWFSEAAQAGDASGQYSLGLMLHQGQGVARDLAGARRWYEAAARQGLGGAMNNLGIMYDLGESVAADAAMAYAWFALGAYAGDPHAAKNRDLTSQELSPADLERGQALFHELRGEIGGG